MTSHLFSGFCPKDKDPGIPCAPVNSNVGGERRTSKGSMANMPSEWLGEKLRLLHPLFVSTGWYFFFFFFYFLNLVKQFENKNYPPFFVFWPGLFFVETFCILVEACASIVLYFLMFDCFFLFFFLSNDEKQYIYEQTYMHECFGFLVKIHGTSHSFLETLLITNRWFSSYSCLTTSWYYQINVMKSNINGVIDFSWNHVWMLGCMKLVLYIWWV